MQKTNFFHVNSPFLLVIYSSMLQYLKILFEKCKLFSRFILGGFMRYDFGAVYKEIRKSKGLSQADVCGEVLSRTSLAKIESGKVTPKYENMEFLLRQIDMSFEEFEYICHLYKPTPRSVIFNKALNIKSISGTQDLEELQELCEKYLRTEYDLPIQHIYDLAKLYISIRKNGVKTLNKQASTITKQFWNYLEKEDTWYESDFRILASILHHFSIDTVHLITDKILENLEKYKNYKNFHNNRLSILFNLAGIYLHYNEFQQCEKITVLALEIAQKLKRYDALALCNIRLGICKNNNALIEKGVALLEITDEYELLKDIKHEINHFYKSSF